MARSEQVVWVVVVVVLTILFLSSCSSATVPKEGGCPAPTARQRIPEVTPEGIESRLRFCAIEVERVGPHFSYSGRILGTGSPDQHIVVLDNFDFSTCFADGKPPVPIERGGYYYLAEVTPNQQWTFYDPSTNGRDKLTLRRYVSYYFASSTALDKLKRQADREAGNAKNDGINLARAGVGPELAKLTIEPLGTPGHCEP